MAAARTKIEQFERFTRAMNLVCVTKSDLKSLSLMKQQIEVQRGPFEKHFLNFSSINHFLSDKDRRACMKRFIVQF